jgi:hypothetical protein
MSSLRAGVNGGRLDAAIAAGAYEVALLRLALGALGGLRRMRAGALAAGEEVDGFLDELVAAG